MKYIVRKRFKAKAICGDVNLPYGTECECSGGFITHNGKLICAVTSQNAYDYFSTDDDGNGLRRGELVADITGKLGAKIECQDDDEKHQAMWDKLWDDAVANKLRRQDYTDYWLWGQAFYEADVAVLEHILSLIKEAEKCTK